MIHQFPLYPGHALCMPITALCKPYDISVDLRFPRLYGELSENSDILKGNRVQCGGRVLEPDTLGQVPALSSLSQTAGRSSITSRSLPPLYHGMWAGSPSEQVAVGGGEGLA